MTRLVLDASAALAWCFADEQVPADEQLLQRVTDHGADAPTIWPLEIANVLTLAERKGRLSPLHRSNIIEKMRTLDIQIHEASYDTVFNEISLLARENTLTIYDASYLELAIRLRRPLASRDERLKHAGRSMGIEVIEY